MDIKTIFIFIPIIALIIGAVYLNVIFPKKIEREQSEKQENIK